MDMNFIFSCSTALTREISSWPLEDKIHIHARACNILYVTDIFAIGTGQYSVWGLHVNAE